MEASQISFSTSKPSILSKLFFCWVIPFGWHGYKNDVQAKDVYNMSEKGKAEEYGDILERNWNSEVTKANKYKTTPSLLRVMIRTYGVSYMKKSLWLLIQLVILRCSQPYMLSLYIQYFRKADVEEKTGWATGIGYILFNFLAGLMLAQYMSQCEFFGLKVKVACCSLVFRKLLKLRFTSLSQIGSGQVVNLMSNDVQRIETAALNIHYLHCVPLQAIVLCYSIYSYIGISCLPGLVFIFIEGLPVQGLISKLQGKLRLKVAVLTGKRLAIMNDVISGMHVIKMYAWEKPFEAVVSMARKVEFDAISKSAYAKGVTVAMVIFTERFCLFLMLITYVLLGNRLTSDVVFSLAVLVNSLQLSLCYYLPVAFESYAEIKVSIVRLQEILLLDEKEHLGIDNPVMISRKIGSIGVADVRAGWLPSTLTLTDVSLNVTQGTLCCVLGKVGSGKTSLLHLLLRELPPSSGRVDIYGKISYASQEPWLYVASVKNNILFGQPFLQNKYQEVVTVCALQRDFQQFPFRDQTMVGERGVSLSGGQRARINLARAVYLDADVYLLDDPLSAVDTHVAKHLFQECIKKYLRNKTRVLVTHQVQFLKEADLIVILEEGKIGSILRNDEMTENSLKQVSQVFTDQEENDEVKKQFDVIQGAALDLKSGVSGDKIEEQEEIEEMVSKDISLSTYWKYLCSGTNKCVVIFMLVTFVIGQIFVNFSDLWIMHWTNQEEIELGLESTRNNATEGDIYLLPDENIHTISLNSTNLTKRINKSTTLYSTNNVIPSHINYLYLYIYSAIIFCCISLSILRTNLFCKVCLNASKELHKKMVASILRTSMRFFETNPSGRILNRFAKDMGSIDEVLAISFLWTVQVWMVLLGILICICAIVPWMLIPLVIVLGATYYVMIVCSPTLMKLIKFEANSRSPIFSNISATTSGLPTIRSAEAEEMVRKYFDSLQDANFSTQRMVIFFGKMLGLYLEAIWNVFLAVLTIQFLLTRHEKSHSGDIGLLISVSPVIAGLLQYIIIKTTDVVSCMVSVERILEYQNIENENVAESANKEKLMQRWPHSGKIVFSNVYLSYVPNEPPVLKNLSFSIRAGEKIGIVGRTGAGKSSLITCLFRLAPIEGTVAIDDVDTATVELKTIRTRISIIPQEPVLFSETLRYNLDPLGNATDEILWKVLENVKLKESIESLDQKVSSGGSNFSVGQRQLICLARAVLRNNRILVMDEATANVDQNTDSLIQTTIRENFWNCTVLTIAHRLNTIMDSDRVLVMSSGQVVEFAHPHELLQKPNSYFSEMVRETGRAVEDALRKTAMEDFERKFFDIS